MPKLCIFVNKMPIRLELYVLNVANAYYNITVYSSYVCQRKSLLNYILLWGIWLIACLLKMVLLEWGAPKFSPKHCTSSITVEICYVSTEWAECAESTGWLLLNLWDCNLIQVWVSLLISLSSPSSHIHSVHKLFLIWHFCYNHVKLIQV